MNDQSRPVNLGQSHCEACRAGVPPLTSGECEPFLKELASGWEVIDGRRLLRTFTFPDFKTALDFVNRVGDEAEAEQHHPHLELDWGKVVIRLWTHKIGGLSRNDFVLAARIDGLYHS